MLYKPGCIPSGLTIRVLVGLLTAYASLAMGQNTITLREHRLDQVMSALTLDEKVSLLHGAKRVSREQGPTVESNVDARVPGAGGHSHAIERAGIPSLIFADGPAGLRILPTRDQHPGKRFYATAFPVATALAASWDTDLVAQVGAAIGEEARDYGVDVLLAPALNIHRYALGGRNFEYFSEDPLLSGKMAASYVNGVQTQGVGTTLKHFVANNHEWNRNTIDVQVSERALREIYLRGFEIAVKEAQPWAVMSSYNKLQGEYTSESPRLLTTILRDEWGFNGLVMTDWFGGMDTTAQMLAGNDLLMPGTDAQHAALVQAVVEERLPLSVIDRNATRMLELIRRSLIFAGQPYSDAPDLSAHATVARKAAAESMVLLKHDAGVLPLMRGLKLALLGSYSYDLLTGGTGSGDVNEAYSISLEQGLSEAGFGLNPILAQEYHHHIKTERADWPVPKHFLEAFLPRPQLSERVFSDAQLDQLAQQHDAAVITIGRSSGEFVDRDVSNFSLSDQERQLIERAAVAFHAAGRPLIVILNVGGVIETASWRDNVDAIVLAHQPGQEAGHAIADVLSGRVNPSGRLADSWPLRLMDYPAHAGFPGVVTDERAQTFGFLQAQPSAVTYDDDIWVGYRHFNRAPNNDGRLIEVAYPFGFGLSYTQFEFGKLKANSDDIDDRLVLEVSVTNTGDTAGKEVVQMYVAAPQDEVEKPDQELRAFAKTPLLQPGEQHTLRFELVPRDFASYSEQDHCWRVSAGPYRINAASSSRHTEQSLTVRNREARCLSLREGN